MKKPIWKNPKAWITFDILMLIGIVVQFYFDNDWKDAITFGTIFILCIGLQMMNMKEDKERGE